MTFGIHRETTEGYSRLEFWKITASLRKLVSTMGVYTSPKKGRNQVSGKESVPCWLATPVIIRHGTTRNSVKVKFGMKVMK